MPPRVLPPSLLPERPLRSPPSPEVAPPEPPIDEPIQPARWRWLGAGLLAAWISGLVLPRSFTWFLCAIPHEMGHATLGCVLGHPSAPAISLRGEAWTGIAELRPWLVWTMALAAAAAAVHLRRRRAAGIALGIVAVLVPLLAFARAADVLIIGGGHVGELAFATWCFAMAWTGGRTGTPQERTACAMAGALVQCTNLKLCFGLLTSAAARDTYAHNGSIGLKNDYLVLAEDLLHCRLPSVAMAMLVLGLLPLPLGLLLGWWRERCDTE